MSAAVLRQGRSVFTLVANRGAAKGGGGDRLSPSLLDPSGTFVKLRGDLALAYREVGESLETVGRGTRMNQCTKNLLRAFLFYNGRTRQKKRRNINARSVFLAR